MYLWLWPWPWPGFDLISLQPNCHPEDKHWKQYRLPSFQSHPHSPGPTIFSYFVQTQLIIMGEGTPLKHRARHYSDKEFVSLDPHLLSIQFLSIRFTHIFDARATPLSPSSSPHRTTSHAPSPPAPTLRASLIAQQLWLHSTHRLCVRLSSSNMAHENECYIHWDGLQAGRPPNFQTMHHKLLLSKMSWIYDYIIIELAAHVKYFRLFYYEYLHRIYNTSSKWLFIYSRQ